MFGLDYNHISRIQDTKGREAAYAEQLKVDYYMKSLDGVIQPHKMDLIRSSEYSSELLRDSIDKYNSSLTEGMKNLGLAIEDIEGALIDINEGIDQINSELTQISGILDWGFNIVIENQRLTFLVLNEIKKLETIPDNEKRRIRLIQLGIERQTEAFYNPRLYKKAIDYYLEALAILEDDPFVLNRLGIIYLFSKEDIQFDRAAYFFEQAVEYILPKYKSNKDLPDDFIYKQLDGLLAPQRVKDLKQQCSISLYYAGQTNLFLGNIQKAIGYLEDAITISQDFSEAKYLYIKALLIVKSNKKSESLLLELIEKSPLYYFKLKRDKFFDGYPNISRQLESYMDQLRNSLKAQLGELQLIIAHKSVLKREFSLILSAYNTNHLLGLLRAKKLLHSTMIVELSHYNMNLSSFTMKHTGTLRDLIIIENNIIKDNESERSRFTTALLKKANDEKDRKIELDRLKAKVQRQSKKDLRNAVLIIVGVLVLLILAVILATGRWPKLTNYF